MKVLTLVIILFTGLSLKNTVNENAWHFVKETNGVKVFYRETAGSPIREVKITTTFDADMNSVLSVLGDVKNYPKWVYGATESRILKRISPIEMNYYNKLDFPWPLDDRDIVIHTKIQQKNGLVYSVSEAAPQALPVNAGLVRMTHFNSRWTFKTDDKQVQAEYQFSSDPGGNIPTWMVNMALDQGPLKTIQNFKKLLRETEVPAN